MLGAALRGVHEPLDWQAPWLDVWRVPGERVAQRVAGGMALHEALNREPDNAIAFVPQADLPPGESYERYIFNSKQCPTREGLHDFFNGLCWIRLPQTKTKLNQLQALEIERAGVQAVRGPVRDALTLFDENAAFLQAPPALWQALIDRDWHRLFVQLRPLWAQARLVLFGHALLEKLVQPRKAVTAHVYLAQTAIHSIAELDAWVAADLNAPKLAAKPFAPLPVLGVPGWWPPNETPAFYDDPEAFRPPRSAAHSPEYPQL
ncbi:DUF3025 domain-containing protein [Polaromonas sp. C04]|uniref:DUF3025 domain-containing protein n=1 Tax=Polaromonas sp. C04 TaxID=1945857 RepID=UPI0009D1E821|nr:DUF3025 domain-containing protein [Polaromonas sp. C04]OOG50655.1 hypothetical protein B0E49_18180 [Polaromonas sp. C04]